MASPEFLSPADEYERGMELRRERARPGVAAAFFLWAVCHGTAALFLMADGLGGAAVAVALLFWVASGVPAAVALVVLARNWGVLSGGQRIACAAPAGVMLAEMVIPSAVVTWAALL